MRYAADGAEFQEAVAALRSLLPPDSVAREGLLAWVRSSMLDEGARRRSWHNWSTWTTCRSRSSRPGGKGAAGDAPQGAGRGPPGRPSRGPPGGPPRRGRQRDPGPSLERLVAKKFGADAAVQLSGLIGDLDGRDELDAAAAPSSSATRSPELLARLRELVNPSQPRHLATAGAGLPLWCAWRERKFGRETAKELGVLLETVSGFRAASPRSPI